MVVCESTSTARSPEYPVLDSVTAGLEPARGGPSRVSCGLGLGPLFFL